MERRSSVAATVPSRHRLPSSRALFATRRPCRYVLANSGRTGTKATAIYGRCEPLAPFGFLGLASRSSWPDSRRYRRQLRELAAPCELGTYFTAPKVSPRTSCFCVNHPSTMIGATAKKEAAESLAQNSPGGAKNRLWLEIKASIYNCPILVPSEPECGVLGCAMLAGVAAGLFTDLASAGSQQVRYEGEIAPNRAWSERYRKMQSLFDDLYQSSQKFWDRLEG
jgi:hypothetical protein